MASIDALVKGQVYFDPQTQRVSQFRGISEEDGSFKFGSLCGSFDDAKRVIVNTRPVGADVVARLILIEQPEDHPELLVQNKYGAWKVRGLGDKYELIMHL